MKLRDLFRTKKATSEELAAALADIDKQAGDAQRRLDEILASFGEDAILAGSEAELRKLESALLEMRAQVERLSHMRASVEARLRDASGAERAQELSVRWDACEQRLKARDQALERVQALAEQLAVAVVEAQEASAEVWRATPDEVRGKHWQSDFPRFTDVATAAMSEVAASLRVPDPTTTRTTLHQQALAHTLDMLNLRRAAA